MPALVRASVEPMLNGNSTTTFITTELTEAEYEFNKLPVKRRRIRRNLELNGCFCGSVLDSSMASVIECKRIGCETQWISRVSYLGLQSFVLKFVLSIIGNVTRLT